MNHSRKTKTQIFSWLLSCFILLAACSAVHFRNQYENINSLIHQKDSILKKSFLKAHLKNGQVCVLETSWSYDYTQAYIHGTGIRYDFNRSKIAEGPITILIDSVALFETNTYPKGRIAAMTVITALDALLLIPCLGIPKACFGSCPTFYLEGGKNSAIPDAEGFSNAICPKLEYGDIDALGEWEKGSANISLTMRNEALETHCINELKLFAFPKQMDEKIYHTRDDHFYQCKGIIPVTSAFASEGDITSLLHNPDRNERFSLADDHHLSSKEEIHLEFDVRENGSRKGLVLNFRQSLMTTYFIYSALGYMGDQVSDILSAIETGKVSTDLLESGIYKELGDIEVYQYQEETKKYIHLGRFYETGPIAINQQILPLEEELAASAIRLKLVLNKGLWRLDYAGLTSIDCRVEPLVLHPTGVLRTNQAQPQALLKLQDPTEYLVSLPGQEYTISYTLPWTDRQYDLFLYSKGYYLEWMRAKWITDKNLSRLDQMMSRPVQYLKDQTREYKKYESQMEEIFWNSKINTNSIGHEHQ